MVVPTREYQPAGSPIASMILMHGLGASSDDLYPLASTLADGRLRVVCPNAPQRSVTINGGLTMPAWYDIVGANLEDRQNIDSVRQSADLIEALIEQEEQRGFPAHRLFLAGFSQGAAMALYTGLRHPKPLAGLIALSGYLLFAEDMNQATTANQQTAIFQAHGCYDPVVLPDWARNSRDVLKQHHYPLTYHEYPMAHAIVADELTDLNTWLNHQLTTFFYTAP